MDTKKIFIKHDCRIKFYRFEPSARYLEGRDYVVIKTTDAGYIHLLSDVNQLEQLRMFLNVKTSFRPKTSYLG